ncbi:IclR family transcriptional regulator [Peptoniphilaceae bacterium SGI.131]
MQTYHNPTYRVIQILNLISQKNDLTLSEISKDLSISKSTLQPILKTLLELDYLAYDEDKRLYRIGIGFFKSAQSFLGTSNSFDIIKKSMKTIVKKCNEICQMGIYDKTRKGNVFYIAKEEPIQSISLISSIGTSLPAYATALGKCILSGFSNDEIKEIYSSGLVQLTPHTKSNVMELLKDIELVRTYGYAYEREESALDIECIAVPIIQDKKVIASISVSIPKYRSSVEKVENIKNILMTNKNSLELLLSK